jgi:hypothetical protein
VEADLQDGEPTWPPAPLAPAQPFAPQAPARAGWIGWPALEAWGLWARSPAGAVPRPPRYGLALLLFGLTFFCTTTLGPVLYVWSRDGLPAGVDPLLTPSLVARVWGDAALLRLGLSFSLPVLTILLVHEMGHYLACRHYRLPSTLPYFLPLPAVLGTLGAFIRIRVPMRSKRELFDVGVAGPLAGFVALLPFLLYGVAHSQPVALRAGAGALRLVPGQCLALELVTWLFHGRLASGEVLRLHPCALAAWFGLLATAINLLPLGQLDGGHILYAVAGRWQRRLALPLWGALALAGMLWGGWVLWCVVIFAMGLFHPAVIDEATPLDRRRLAVAAAALLVLVLCFTPRGATEPDIVAPPGSAAPAAPSGGSESAPAGASAPGSPLASLLRRTAANGRGSGVALASCRVGSGWAVSAESQTADFS